MKILCPWNGRSQWEIVQDIKISIGARTGRRQTPVPVGTEFWYNVPIYYDPTPLLPDALDWYVTHLREEE